MDECGSVLSLYLRIQLRRAVLGVVGGALQDFTGATGAYPVPHAFIFNDLDHLGAERVPNTSKSSTKSKSNQACGVGLARDWHHQDITTTPTHPH